MRNIKAKYLWISVGVSFLIAGGLIFAVTQTSGVWTNVVIVLIAITFIYSTIAIQAASTKTFKYKPKPKHYIEKRFIFNADDIENKLKKEGYKARIFDYGVSYLKVDVPHAYKIVFVKNVEKYFNHNEEKNNQSVNHELEKCDQFMGIEIFLDKNEEALQKLPDFNIQGEKVYYAGYYIEDNYLICPNFLEPKEHFKDSWNTIYSDLKLDEIEEAVS